MFFIPCTISGSLVKAVTEAAHGAASGDVVFLLPADWSFDQIRNGQAPGEALCRTVKSIGWGVRDGDPKITGKKRGDPGMTQRCARIPENLLRVFLREKPRSKTNQTQSIPQQKN